MIKVLAGIVWHETPSVRQSTLTERGDTWYVGGIERVETPGTAGWRHTEHSLYLALDGTWKRTAEYFPTQDAALAALRAAVGTVEEPSDTSPFALAFQKATGEKRKK